MKQIMKKVIAIICAIAMVVSTVTVYNNTASAAVADLPESGAGVVIEVNNFGAGEVLFLAGLDTIAGATSYNLYMDGTLWGTVTNGANLELTNFPSGAHTFCVTGVNADGEFAKSRDISVTIPNYGTVTTPEVVDGTELLKGLTFADADTTTDEATTESLWIELGGTYTNNGDGSVTVAVPAYESGDNWATQLKQNNVQLVKDKWYVAKFKVTSDVDKKIQMLVQQNVNWTVFAEKIVAVAAGTTEEVEVVFQAAQTTDKVLFGFMMGYVDNTACDAANVTISDVSLTAYNANPNGDTETTTLDNSGEQPSDNDETTTPDSSGEQPSDNDETTTPTPVQTEQSDATEAAGFADLMNEGFLAGDVGANQYKAICGKGLIGGIVNIQKYGAATEYGIYVTFKDADIGEITVNGVEMDVFVDGAGAILYLSNFEYMYSDVVVKSSNGTQKAVLYIYNAQGIDNSDKAIEQEITTPADGEQSKIELQQLALFGRYVEYGSYMVMRNEYVDAYVGVDSSNRDRVQVRNATGPSDNTFIISRAYKGLTKGVKYVLSVDITPSVANGSYKTMKDTVYTNLKEGTTTVSMVSKAYESNGAVQADFTMYLNNLGSDVVLEISNPQFREATEDDLTTQAPTTPAPTTPTPTTPQATTPEPTTPQATTPSVVDPTTVAPTTATPTTVAPTTTKKATVKPPKKTSVKSASKKKASKKVKVSIKNVKGANGYRVQFSTTKKFKKVLVTKNVKKATITISSKALKNKKKLYVRVKAYKLDGKKKVLAKKWSTAKAVKIRK